MKQDFLALSLGIGAMLLATQHAFAQPRPCAPRDDIAARLGEFFGETRHSIGLSADDRTVEIYASAETGSWTITTTDAGGITCLIASGQAFETMAEPLRMSGKDA